MSRIELPPPASGCHLLVELHNRDHLAAAYGETFARAALAALQWRMHLAGHSIKQAGDRRFVAWIAEAGSFAEHWQLQLAGLPLEHLGQRALPVVTVGEVRLSSTSGPYPPQELERLGGRAPILEPVQCGWIWRERYEKDMALALAFHEALRSGEVGLTFQPIMRRNAGDRRDASLYQEALLRLDQPGIGASGLVAAMERLGLVRLLDRVVLDAVIERLEREPTLHAGCNLSSHSLVDDAWWHGPLRRLQEQPTVAARLTLEITETAPLGDFESAKTFVGRLRALGCQIAIDDFGEGHTRLDFVRQILPQVVKISGTLLAEAMRSITGAREFSHLVALGGSIAPYVVAEGVERASDTAVALAGGVNCLQGLAIARPAGAWPPSRVCLPPVCRSAA